MEKELSKEEAEMEEPPTTTSLFPVFFQTPPSDAPAATATAASTSGGEWLCNASFTTSLSVINDAVSSHYDHQLPYEPDVEAEAEEANQKENERGKRAQYELLDSSASDRGNSSSEEEKDGKRKKRKKKDRKRRRKERSSDASASFDFAYPSSRKPDVKTWASSSTSAADAKGYHFDSHGDRDNLAFGSLYRMDVARYKLYNSKRISELTYYRKNQRSGNLEGDCDIDALDGKFKSGGRYWSSEYTVLEHHKNLKRLRILARGKPSSSISSDFIPLHDGLKDKPLTGATIVEESWEDEVLRKTKDFNKMTRENPHDEKVWMAFAEFQDKVASMQPQKGARLQTLEKKISILEKATEINPENEDLLLSLMSAYQTRDSTDILIGRWEKILMQNSGSYKLWKEFLWFVQCEFSRFKVSDMRRMYANAIKALSGACSRHYRCRKLLVPELLIRLLFDKNLI